MWEAPWTPGKEDVRCCCPLLRCHRGPWNTSEEHRRRSAGQKPVWLACCPPWLGALRKTTPFLLGCRDSFDECVYDTGQDACARSSHNTRAFRHQETLREMGNVILQVCPEPESTAGVGDPGSGLLNSCLQPLPALECGM